MIRSIWRNSCPMRSVDTKINRSNDMPIRCRQWKATCSTACMKCMGHIPAFRPHRTMRLCRAMTSTSMRRTAVSASIRGDQRSRAIHRLRNEYERRPLFEKPILAPITEVMLMQKVGSRSRTLHGKMMPGPSRSYPRLCIICMKLFRWCRLFLLS